MIFSVPIPFSLTASGLSVNTSQIFIVRIELDGMQHNTEFAMEYDSIRTAFFESMEVMVLRFSNREIQSQFEKVCETIDLAVKRRI